MTIVRVPAGARIRITCKSKIRRRCPKSVDETLAKPAAKKDYTKLYRKRKLPVGTVVTITVSSPQAIGKVLKITVRGKRRNPTRVPTCLDPAGRTVSCS
jgi:hypothetical protein